MLEIILYAFGIMYSPGPVNTLALLAGVNGQGWRVLFYCVGVSLAMLIWFLLIGYLGSEFIPKGYQSVISILGAVYIVYLAVKIMWSSFQKENSNHKNTEVSFKTGLVLQLCNPKSMVAIVPIVTVQFPRMQIEGGQIALWSIGLSIMACGAPSIYLLVGSCLKNTAKSPIVMAWVNRIMATLLFFVAYRFVFT
ncbi:LysE family transporter [Paraglaciecola sp.]|uniref:LysE family translocator n=2 Tax=Paraglaciecola sp. TaxID=1920173 RepID=UPI003296E077